MRDPIRNFMDIAELQALEVKAWVYFLQKKPKDFKYFLEFKAEAEQQSEKKWEMLKSNSRGEYKSLGI